MPKTETRPGHETEQALLDAAERLLIEVGAAGITTRRVADEAGANHGLVHYYFGSVEQLLVRVLERFTERLIERQRQMYAADMPFRREVADGDGLPRRGSRRTRRSGSSCRPCPGTGPSSASGSCTCTRSGVPS